MKLKIGSLIIIISAVLWLPLTIVLPTIVGYWTNFCGTGRKINHLWINNDTFDYGLYCLLCGSIYVMNELKNILLTYWKYLKNWHNQNTNTVLLKKKTKIQKYICISGGSLNFMFSIDCGGLQHVGIRDSSSLVPHSVFPNPSEQFCLSLFVIITVCASRRSGFKCNIWPKRTYIKIWIQICGKMPSSILTHCARRVCVCFVYINSNCVSVGMIILLITISNRVSFQQYVTCIDKTTMII